MYPSGYNLLNWFHKDKALPTSTSKTQLLDHVLPSLSLYLPGTHLTLGKPIHHTEPAEYPLSKKGGRKSTSWGQAQKKNEILAFSDGCCTSLPGKSLTSASCRGQKAYIVFFFCNCTKNTLLLWAAANNWLVTCLFLRSIFSKTSEVRWQFQ